MMMNTFAALGQTTEAKANHHASCTDQCFLLENIDVAFIYSSVALKYKRNGMTHTREGVTDTGFGTLASMR